MCECVMLRSLRRVYSAPREGKCACVLSGLPLHFLLFFSFSLKYRENERRGGSQSLEGRLLVRDCFCLTDEFWIFVFLWCFVSYTVISHPFRNVIKKGNQLTCIIYSRGERLFVILKI